MCEIRTVGGVGEVKKGCGARVRTGRPGGEAKVELLVRRRSKMDGRVAKVPKQYLKVLVGSRHSRFERNVMDLRIRQCVRKHG